MSQNIIIRTPNHLGDCLMAMPMINNVGEAYPGGTVTLLTPSHLADLFRPNPAVDGIIEIPLEYQHGLMAVVKIRDMISSLEFDIGYILPPSFGAAAGFKLGSVKERIGYIADGRRLLLTKALPLVEPINSVHRSELYYDLLRRSTKSDLEYIKPKLFLNDDDINNGIELLDGFNIKATDRFACVAFKAVAESRRWGMDNYTELIKELIPKLNLKIILIGSASDQEDGDLLAERTSTKEVVNLTGKTNLREAAAILSLSQVFIGNDSGPAHLAASIGANVVVLSGADDPKSTSPIATNKQLIYLENLECISCVKNKCPLKDDLFMQCMTGISVDMVFDAVEELLDK